MVREGSEGFGGRVMFKGMNWTLVDDNRLCSIMMFAFRYGETRNTGAPLMIANFIKSNYEILDENAIREIHQHAKGQGMSDYIKHDTKHLKELLKVLFCELTGNYYQEDYLEYYLKYHPGDTWPYDSARCVFWFDN